MTRVPLRDGSRLVADVHAGPDAAPAVLIRTPYHRSLFDIEVAPLRAAGYAVVVQSVRGRHGSDGTFVPFAAEGRDGYDTVEWVAAQPWCDGRVAMAGASYGAWVQWAAAREQPPHLVALVSSACCACFTGEWPWRNGVLFPGAITWLHMVAGSEDQSPEVKDGPFAPLSALQERFQQRLPQAGDWLQHPNDDDYWAPLRLTPQDFSRIDLPVLHVTGWFDGCQLGTHFLYGGMRAHSPAAARQSLLVGPWDHTVRAPQRSYDGRDFGPGSVLDYHAQRIAWLDSVLAGSPPLQARVFTTGVDTWKDLSSFPPPTTQQTWHLVPGWALAPEPPEHAPPASFRHDPCNPVPARPDGSPGAHPYLARAAVHARPDVLVHESEPLSEDLALMGQVQVHLDAATTGEDTDWFVELVDVGPDGSDLLVAHAVVRASTVATVVPGQVQGYDLVLTPRAHVFRRGHRLVVAVASSAAPLYAPHPGHRGDHWSDPRTMVTTNTVHGGTVSLPVG